MFSGGDNPEFGITARLIDASSARILWADFVSVTGDDFTGILGLGTIRTLDELVSRVLDRLLATFNPARYEEESDFKIAVMPFKNVSGSRNAGMIASTFFTIALVKSSRFERDSGGDGRRVCPFSH